MAQAKRMNSADNSWEADPWDASDTVADAQLAGFTLRSVMAIDWRSVRHAGPMVFGLAVQQLIGADVAFVAECNGEDMLLMQLDWHGFPDPPEWRLATRPSGGESPWESWGYFAEVPGAWRLPPDGS
jgi:hypothetical protein